MIVQSRPGIRIIGVPNIPNEGLKYGDRMRIKEVEGYTYIEKIGSPRAEWLGPFSMMELTELIQHIKAYLKMGPDYDLDKL